MSQTFVQLGLRPELMQAAEATGFEHATTIQSSAIPVLRRGGNMVIHASTGSGVTLAYALPLLDRISQNATTGTGPRMLVLVPTADRATRKAMDLTRIANTVGLRAVALAPGWSRRGDAAIVVATIEMARQAVERSELKLDALDAFVLVDANAQLSDDRDSLMTLMTSIPKDAQRVVTSAELNADVERFVEAHVRKAMNVPTRSDEVSPSPATIGDLDYVVVPESRKEALLVRLLEERVGSRPVVVVRSAASGETLRQALSVRGFNADSSEGADVRIVTPNDAEGASNEISYDVPFEGETLKNVHADGGLILVTPPELPHLRSMASAVGLSLKAERVQSPAGDGLAEYRRLLRQAVHDEDVDAQMAVLDPLFDEFSPAEIAAALSALFRKRVAPRPAVGLPAATAVGAPRPPSAEAGFVRLFLGIGTRDNVRAGDLVGAITGEAGINGDQVGKVDIKDTYTVVEVSTSVADKVIRTMNGTTMRGRSLRVDYDRKGAAQREEKMGGVRDTSRGGARDAPRGPRDSSGGASRDSSRGVRDSSRGGAPRGTVRDNPRDAPRGGGGPRGGAGDRPPRRDGPPRY